MARSHIFLPKKGEDMDTIQEQREVELNDDMVAGIFVCAGAALLGGLVGYNMGRLSKEAAVSKAYKRGFRDGHNTCGHRLMEIFNAYDVKIPHRLEKDVAAGKIPILRMAGE